MNQNDKPGAGAPPDRKARLAAELRENLKKRKSQRRKRQEAAQAADSAPPSPAER